MTEIENMKMRTDAAMNEMMATIQSLQVRCVNLAGENAILKKTLADINNPISDGDKK